MASSEDENELRELAILWVTKKRDFRRHLFIYAVVNAALVIVWLVTGLGFFWPIFVILGWGIGVAANAWDVYARMPVTEEEIQSEMAQLRR